MSQVEPVDQEEKPLDPVMEKLRRKMMRLQLVSAGIMFVSLMAVLAAVVYKATSTPGKENPATATAGVPSDHPVTAAALLPAGFRVESTSLSGGQILFYGRDAAGKARALVFDTTVGRIVADIAVVTP